MTQKELLYVEDAIKHENNIAQILEESINYLDDEKLISFMENEKKEHENMARKLMETLESEVK